jgi:hypothetical protein
LKGKTKTCPVCGREISVHSRCCVREEPVVTGNYLNSAESMFQEPPTYYPHNDYWKEQEEEFG